MNMKDVQRLFLREDGNQFEQAKIFSISPYTKVEHLDHIVQAFESVSKKMRKKETAYVL